MKVVILAGGKGTRLGADRPKPMMEIGGVPLLTHIMNIYRGYNYNDFIIATGFMGNYIKDYYFGQKGILCLDTGINGGTARRIRQCALRIEEEQFLVSYGDSPADVNIDALVKSYSGTVTLTAVHPPPRYGHLVIWKKKVVEFIEKQPCRDWVNGGFFVVNTEFACRCTDVSWEFETLPLLAQKGELGVYKHPGFWMSMDTPKDLDTLNQMWAGGKAPWA